MCAVPIGDDGDITQRVRDVLARCPVILCEDTRVTHALLARLGIRNQQQLQRMDHYQERRSLNGLDRAIACGDVALVTDAGSPGVSDPGAMVVRHARQQGYAVHILPGPSALTAFITGCGVSLAAFYFGGFMPKSTAMGTAIDTVVHQGRVGIWYESPKRIQQVIGYCCEHWPTVHMVMAKELTKPYSTFIEGNPSEMDRLIAAMDTRGEWVIMIDARRVAIDPAIAVIGIANTLKEAGLSGAQVKAIAHLLDCRKNALYNAYNTLG
jgi:16S rRNA (cytidine1402-2'-O)-methyltransferase